MLAALKRIGATESPNDDTLSESNGESLQYAPVDHICKLMMSVLCSRGRETGLPRHYSMSEGFKQWVRRTLAIVATTITTNKRRNNWPAQQRNLIGVPCNAQQRVNEHRC
jgi:hypothetical protein